MLVTVATMTTAAAAAAAWLVTVAGWCDPWRCRTRQEHVWWCPAQRQHQGVRLTTRPPMIGQCPRVAPHTSAAAACATARHRVTLVPGPVTWTGAAWTRTCRGVVHNSHYFEDSSGMHSTLRAATSRALLENSCSRIEQSHHIRNRLPLPLRPSPSSSSRRSAPTRTTTPSNSRRCLLPLPRRASTAASRGCRRA